MKKVLSLLPLFLGILACGTQPLPTQDISNIVNATLTAIHNNDSQNTAPQPTFTPVIVQELPTEVQVTSLELRYYWPTNIPEGFVVNSSNSNVTGNGFSLQFIYPSIGTIDILGGEHANQYAYCPADSIPQVVKGFSGCFPQSTGGGFSVQWREENISYSVGGFGLSRDLALQIAEQLEALDINTWQERLNQ
jgi:hypothetical protein